MSIFILCSYLGKLGQFIHYLLTFIVALEIGYRAQFDERISISVLKSLADTNSGEIFSMISTLLPLAFWAIISFTIYIWIANYFKLATDHRS
ncbi:hypothetical protein [Candidatus Nitrosacidococcus sp. I8]|uniref:hypothetical protein n=1 Tax=Candidatus Nitrosacidococcus sp. I8 TaxID=2942908 RepID=UPI002225C1CF|nr:hypothetical protein [Candidatus Nitrosacidococcus sp. I8]CAH9018641.1 hypothetical protein NURINAE_01046 [Candidatus Nitrosacidococcus sp. I8]